MSLCDALALLIGLFGGFYAIATSSKEGLEYCFPIKVDDVGIHVKRIKDQHRILHQKNGADIKDHGCEKTGFWLIFWLKSSQGMLLLPSLVFLSCMLFCSYEACMQYDAIKETVSPAVLPEVMQRLAAIQMALANGSPASDNVVIQLHQIDQDIKAAALPPSELKIMFILAVKTFSALMLSCLVLAWVFRWFASRRWNSLKHDLLLVPNDVQDYDALKVGGDDTPTLVDTPNTAESVKPAHNPAANQPLESAKPPPPARSRQISGSKGVKTEKGKK